jgi:CheY-like chemotaxis protein
MSEKVINILMVEDDEIDIMNVRRAFKKNNVTNPLHITNNGIEALDYLKEINETAPLKMPKIILLDLNMPKMGGIEFLRELRKMEHLKTISVFVMTTSNEDNDKVEAYNLNVAGYILKPLSMDQFMDVVSTLNSYWKLCEFPA